MSAVGEGSDERAPDARLIALGCAVALGALWLPWVRAGIGGSDAVLGRELWAARVGVGVVVVASSLAAVWASRHHGSDRRLVVGVPGGGLAVSCALGILLAESIAAAIPRDLLPVTVRRLSVEVSAGSGIWIAALAGLVLVTASTGRTASVPWRVPASRVGRGLVARGPALVLGLGGAGVALSRYASWTEARAADHVVGLEGYALPWVGPATLVSAWALAAAAGVALVRPVPIVALVGVLAGWVASLLAASALLATSALARLRLSRLEQADRLPHVVAAADPRVVSLPAARWCFVAALVGCAGALWLLARCASGGDPDDGEVEEAAASSWEPQPGPADLL